MSETGLTTIQLKKINKSKVYHYIYQQHTTSKLQIVQELQMGLSTVSQNLTLLEQEGYIPVSYTHLHSGASRTDGEVSQSGTQSSTAVSETTGTETVQTTEAETVIEPEPVVAPAENLSETVQQIPPF